MSGLQIVNVPDTPWGNLGVVFKHPLTTSREIVETAKLNWTVNSEPMFTHTHGNISGYYSVFRDEDLALLGAVHVSKLIQTQNVDAFRTVEPLLADGRLQAESVMQFGSCDTLLGVFKLTESVEILESKIDQYLLIMNDHLKPDGRVTLLYVPVNCVSNSAINAALPVASTRLRIPIADHEGINRTSCENILMTVSNSSSLLTSRLEKLATQTISTENLDKLLDIWFPMLPCDDIESLTSRNNEVQEILRATFVEDCLGAKYLKKFDGTHYQVFNAIVDFTQHYYKSVESAYDLNFRLKTLTGMSSDGPAQLVSKYLKVQSSLVDK